MHRAVSWGLGVTAIALTLAACDGPIPPPPTLTGLAPDAGRVDQQIDIKVLGTGFAVQAFTDFNAPANSTIDAGYVITVGGIPVLNPLRESTTVLSGTVPAGVPEGPLDVVVTDPWQRTVTLVGGYLGLAPQPAQLGIQAPDNVPLGTCQQVTIQILSAASLPTVTPTDVTAALAMSPGTAAAIYSDASCSTPATTVVVTGGTSSAAPVYVRSTTMAVEDLTATDADGALVPATHTFTFGPTQLGFGSGPRTVTTDNCTSLVVQSQDPAGNASQVENATVVTLAANPSTQFTFYSNSNCTGVITQRTISAGASSTTVYFKGTLPGQVVVTLSTATLASGMQTETIGSGATAKFSFFPISAQGVRMPFLITIRAEDQFGNYTPGYAGDALLSGNGVALNCVAQCDIGNDTVDFVDGLWSGWVSVAPATATASIVADDGFVGTSGTFAVAEPATAVPFPTAFVAVEQGVLYGPGGNTSTNVDAYMSSDYDAGTVLQYAFDPNGTSGTAPAPASFGAADNTAPNFGNGTWVTRVAVRQQNHPSAFSYATATVIRRPNGEGSLVCIVDTSTAVDDGATACQGGTLGADGDLSLSEAIRLSNADTDTTGHPMRYITTDTPARISFPASAPPLTLARPTSMVFATGTQIHGLALTTLAPIVIANAEISGDRPWLVGAQTLTVQDSVIHDFAGFIADAPLTLTRDTFFNCKASAACATARGPNGALVVRGVDFKDAPGGALAATPMGGICPVAVIDVLSATFSRAGTAIRNDCLTNGSKVIHATFDNNAVGVQYAGGNAHELRNAIFTGNVQASVCTAATFAINDTNMDNANGALGCAISNSTADPVYVLPQASDLRLSPSSATARETAFNTGLDVNRAAPGSVFGANPDRGGQESP